MSYSIIVGATSVGTLQADRSMSTWECMDSLIWPMSAGIACRGGVKSPEESSSKVRGDKAVVLLVVSRIVAPPPNVMFLYMM